MKQIDHEPNESRPTNAIWWFWLVALALMWAWAFYFVPIDWRLIGLGFLTGLIFVSWAMDRTGGKVPDSWRGKSSRSGGPRIGE